MHGATVRISLLGLLILALHTLGHLPERVAVYRAAAPVLLTIPSIGVRAAVQPVGTTADGSMQAPTRPEDVAWFEPGTRPGTIGSAVIAGHSGTWKNGKGSVFDSLQRLKPGDTVQVEDARGERTDFIVRGTRIFDPEADATEVFRSSDGKARLNLITCEGAWDATTRSYPERLVIFAEIAEGS